MSDRHFLSRAARRLPPFRRYYKKISRIDAERIAALAQVQRLDAERVAFLVQVQQLDAERVAALVQIQGLEQKLVHAVEKFEAANAVNTALRIELAIAKAKLPDLDRLEAGIKRIQASISIPEQQSLEYRRGLYIDTPACDLFLDLIEAELTGTLREDPSIDPWTHGYNSARRATGRDWPATAETMIGTVRMRNIRTLLYRVLSDNIPGDMIETGVWRGGACIYMRAILAAAGDLSRRVFVADSFKGLPEPSDKYAADIGDVHSTYDQLAVSRAEVEANFKRYGLLDEQVIFLEGWFKDTLPSAPIEKLAILRLDGDMYESTIQALESLYHKVSPGGFVIVDDYILKPCAEAVEDFRASRGIEEPMNDVDGAAVWWRVSGKPRPGNTGRETAD